MKTLTFSLGQDLEGQLKIGAHGRRLSVSEYVRRLLVGALARQEAEELQAEVIRARQIIDDAQNCTSDCDSKNVG